MCTHARVQAQSTISFLSRWVAKIHSEPVCQKGACMRGPVVAHAKKNRNMRHEGVLFCVRHVTNLREPVCVGLARIVYVRRI